MSTRYIVDGIFSAPGIHLVAGASGAGKTTWLLETLVNEWQAGLPVFGCVSHPEPWAYISGDRSEDDVWKRVTSLNLPRSVIPLIPAYALPNGKRVNEEQAVEWALQRGAKTLVWEGFGRYVGDNAKGTKVDQWLEFMTYICIKNDLCIIGVVEQPKMKPRDKYLIPRQRVSGPAAWGHHTQTVVLIEAENERDPRNPFRVVHILSHDIQPLRFRATMATGHFVVLP